MRRVILTVLSFIIGGTTYSQTHQILFVCEHGSAKSMIAAAYFNKYAKDKNLSWEAISRGTSPDQEMSAKTKELLKGDKLYDKNLKPHKLSQADVNNAEQVVMFYALPGDIRVKNNTQYWLDINAVNGDFQKLRDEILNKVVYPLIDSLERNKPSRP